MQYYEHRLDRIEDYLHHRPPYLLVHRIVAIDQRAIETETTLTGTEFFLAGHFPGAPVLPGAMMQEMTTQSAGILIAAKYNPMLNFNTHDPLANEYALGVLVSVKRARYRSFARPGDVLAIQVKLVEKVHETFEFTGLIKVNEKAVMENRFQLTNIPSSLLRG